LPQERLEQAQIAVVNEAFARRFFRGRDPIGKHIVDNNDGPQDRYEIVGVVGDTLETVTENPKPTMYYPLYRGGKPYVYMAVRSSQDPSSVVMPIQRIFSKIDPDLPLSDVMTMDQLIGKQTLEQGFNATLLLVFAVASLMLASVGLFGVLSYIVAQRTIEIGIRIALGARRGQVLWLMLNDGLRPAIFGLVLGLVASVGAAQVIRSLLYATRLLDPLVFAGVVATLLLVATLACLVPAWNASQLDPIQALRSG
jgi:putative ABC transport system permease protein